MRVISDISDCHYAAIDSDGACMQCGEPCEIVSEADQMAEYGDRLNDERRDERGMDDE